MQDMNLRAVIATIEAELEQLLVYPVAAIPPTAVLEVRASFARLTALLALGTEPEVRTCPACKRVVMRAALRCGHCWTKLRPGLPDQA